MPTPPVHTSFSNALTIVTNANRDRQRTNAANKGMTPDPRRASRAFTCCDRSRATNSGRSARPGPAICLGLAVRRRTVQLGFQLRLVDLDIQVIEGAVRLALVRVVVVLGVVVSLPLRLRLLERLLWLLESGLCPASRGSAGDSLASFLPSPSPGTGDVGSSMFVMFRNWSL